MRLRSLGVVALSAALLLLVLAGCSRDSGPTANSVSDKPNEQVADEQALDHRPQLDETVSATVVDAGVDIMARVNGVPISVDQFDRTKQQVLSQYQRIYSQFGQDVRTMLGGAQGRLFDLRIQDEALEQATTRALVLGELDRRNAPVPEDEIDAEFQRQFDQFLAMLGMEEEAFRVAFDDGTLEGYQTGGLTYTQFIEYAKQSVREESEIQAVQALIAGTIQHSTEELRAFFGEHRSDYDISEQIRASHILVADESVARQLLEDLKAGADFAALAHEHSTDTGSGARGGDLGWFERGRMVEAFEEAAFTTPAGELSDVIATQYGYHIIWVTEYQPEARPDYVDVAEYVAADFEAEVMAQRFDDWYELARPAAMIVIEDPMLNAFRKQQDDLDAGLRAFIALRDEGTVDDSYLSYIIGTIYETKMDEARSQKMGIEGSEALTPTQQEAIRVLETEIKTFQSEALASYEAALTVLGSDPEIEARIQMLTFEEANEADETSPE